jgi:hypothetical protein
MPHTNQDTNQDANNAWRTDTPGHAGWTRTARPGDPHHEGSWPHSAAAIERTMGSLNDEQRAKVLGLNAAKLFNFSIPPIS